VTCPEPIVQRMTPVIERFHARHPKLRIESVMSDRCLDLSKGRPTLLCAPAMLMTLTG
jgi:DNA-binding transcriptional LysR family regulator